MKTSYTFSAVKGSGAALRTVFGTDGGETTYVYVFPALSGIAVLTAYQAPTAAGAPTTLSTAREDDPNACVGLDFTSTWQADPNGPPP